MRLSSLSSSLLLTKQGSLRNTELTFFVLRYLRRIVRTSRGPSEILEEFLIECANELAFRMSILEGCFEWSELDEVLAPVSSLFLRVGSVHHVIIDMVLERVVLIIYVDYSLITNLHLYSTGLPRAFRNHSYQYLHG